MGGEPWFYFVPYEPEINKALQSLRRREFEAGRYNPVVMFPEFPVTASSPRPGAGHASIAEALEASEADGTRSILDMERVSEKPGLGVVVPLAAEALAELYGTAHPTREMIEENMDFLEDIERGQGVYIVVYDGPKPSEILFAGYSYD
jgi:hypothetical protein